MHRPLLFILLTLTSAGAIDRSGSVLYTVRTDPITDANTSSVILPELNDTAGRTFLSVICRSGKPDVFLTTKNPLYTRDDVTFGVLPTLQYRVDQQPFIEESGTLSATINGELDVTRLALTDVADTRLMNAVTTGQSKLAVRVVRVERSPLTYQFSLQGFAAAWTRVRGAPKFNLWTFTTCTDDGSGRVTPTLTAGRPSRCQLTIDTVPNGARVINASFQYELEYVEGATKGKLKLDGVQTWSASGAGEVGFRAEGGKLVFDLPLHVRARPNRTYTSINAIGTLVFDNGSSKRIFEPLPVR